MSLIDPLLKMMVVPRTVQRGPVGKCCWSLWNVRRQQMLLLHILNGKKVFSLCLIELLLALELVWEARLITGRDEFTSFEKQFCWYSSGGQQIFYTLALWYCSSSYCNLSSAAIWRQADRKHFFPVLTERGSACWPSCCSLTGAHCYASVQWHVQAACKESCHAMLHWAILAWTKPTVTVS